MATEFQLLWHPLHPIKYNYTCLESGSAWPIDFLKHVYKPFASVVFSQDSNHPLYWSQDGSVNDHWPLLVVTIVATKSFGFRKNNKTLGIYTKQEIQKGNNSSSGDISIFSLFTIHSFFFLPFQDRGWLKYRFYSCNQISLHGSWIFCITIIIIKCIST